MKKFVTYSFIGQSGRGTEYISVNNLYSELISWDCRVTRWDYPDNGRVVIYIDPDTHLSQLFTNITLDRPIDTVWSFTQLFRAYGNNDYPTYPFDIEYGVGGNVVTSGDLNRNNLTYPSVLDSAYDHIGLVHYPLLRDPNSTEITEPVLNSFNTNYLDLRPNSRGGNDYINDIKWTDILYDNGKFKNNEILPAPITTHPSALPYEFTQIANMDLQIFKNSGQLPERGELVRTPPFVIIGDVFYTFDLDAAKAYINDGTVDPEKMHENHGDEPTPPEPSDDGDDPDNNGDSGRTNDSDNMTTNTPSNTPTTLTNTNLYYVSSETLDTFTNEFNTTDITQIFSNWITHKFDNLSQCIVTVGQLPASIIPPIPSVKTPIRLGEISMDTTAYPITGDLKGYAGDIGIDKSNFNGLHNNFLDFEPYTDVMLYLPCVGWLRLDTNLVMHSKLIIEYQIDFLTGKITYFISSEKDNVRWNVNTYSGKIIAMIPITLDNATQTMTQVFDKLANSTLSIAGAVASGGASAVGTAVGAVGSIGSLSTPHVSLVGGADDGAELFAPYSCYVLIKSPSVNQPRNYGEHFGYPLYKQRKLADMTGFTTCENPRIDFTKSLTDNEKETILSTLERGVIL